MGIRRLGRPAGYNYPVGLNAITAPLDVDYLVVAGGGGGAGGSAGSGGGGGAGGYRTATDFNTVGLTFPITVGAGGPAATSGLRGANGSNSVFSTITSLGGGGGGGYDLPPPSSFGVGFGGGSGIVIIRYVGAVQKATGGTVTTPSGYVVHTFTGDGTFSVNATSYSIN